MFGLAGLSTTTSKGSLGPLGSWQMLSMAMDAEAYHYQCLASQGVGIDTVSSAPVSGTTAYPKSTVALPGGKGAEDLELENAAHTETRQHLMQVAILQVNRLLVLEATGEDDSVSRHEVEDGVFLCVEQALCHGLRDRARTARGRHAFWGFVESLSSTFPAATYSLSSIRHHPATHTDEGKGRVWLRRCLADKSLDSCISYLVADEDNLRLWYDAHAFLRDHDTAHTFIMLVSGLASVDFKLDWNLCEDPKIDTDSGDLVAAAAIADVAPGSKKVKVKKRPSGTKKKKVVEIAAGAPQTKVVKKPPLPSPPDPILAAVLLEAQQIAEAKAARERKRRGEAAAEKAEADSGKGTVEEEEVVGIDAQDLLRDLAPVVDSAPQPPPATSPPSKPAFDLTPERTFEEDEAVRRELRERQEARRLEVEAELQEERKRERERRLARQRAKEEELRREREWEQEHRREAELKRAAEEEEEKRKQAEKLEWEKQWQEQQAIQDADRRAMEMAKKKAQEAEAAKLHQEEEELRLEKKRQVAAERERRRQELHQREQQRQQAKLARMHEEESERQALEAAERAALHEERREAKALQLKEERKAKKHDSPDKGVGAHGSPPKADSQESHSDEEHAGKDRGGGSDGDCSGRSRSKAMAGGDTPVDAPTRHSTGERPVESNFPLRYNTQPLRATMASPPTRMSGDGSGSFAPRSRAASDETAASSAGLSMKLGLLLDDTEGVPREPKPAACHGCHLKFGSGPFAYKPRFCQYSRHWFCHSCHKNETHVIPSKILHQWDFKPYKVSTAALEYLTSIAAHPVLAMSGVNPALGKKVSKSLEPVKHARLQLYLMRDYMASCPNFAKRVKKGPGPMLGAHAYLIEDLDSFSLKDFVDTESGKLEPYLTAVVETVVKHITDGCELCRSKGFVCELCHDDGVLFPFQLDTTIQCPDCSTLFHAACYNSHSVACPKCDRIQALKIQKTVPAPTPGLGPSNGGNAGRGGGGDYLSTVLVEDYMGGP